MARHVVPALAVGGLEWVATLIVPSFSLPFAMPAAAGVGLGMMGLCVALAGAASFDRARTTVDPSRPGAAPRQPLPDPS